MEGRPFEDEWGPGGDPAGFNPLNGEWRDVPEHYTLALMYTLGAF